MTAQSDAASAPPAGSRLGAAPAASLAYRVTHSVAGKLFIVVLAILLASFGLLGYVNIRLHREHLEAARLSAALRLSDVVRRSTSYYMLRNDREALHHIVQTIGKEPGITHLRITNHEGRVGFSTASREIGSIVNIPGSAIPLQQSRVFQHQGERFLGVSTPIENSETCSTGACHAHPASQQLLGTLSLDFSLAEADADVRNASLQFISYSGLAILLTLATIGLLVWYLVHEPVHRLRSGTISLGRGELGVQIPVHADDELGELASSFNQMSQQLRLAREESDAWAHTLEQRVQRKKVELERVQEQMVQAEKLTSLGKLAAVVAHEINNPLSGILTYAKLLRKWIDRGDSLEQRAPDMRESLQLIENESRRCGDIVRNLLTFARVQPLNVTDFNVNDTIRHTIKLVEHKLELGNITPRLELDENLPRLRGDAAQIEQLMLALVMNAIEAMPREGNLHLVTNTLGSDAIIIRVEDDGVGIPREVLPRIFEPFNTTKEDKGVGLGLAISHAIVERHGGRIDVQSEVGRGTAFTITLPLGIPPHAPETESEA